MKRKKGFTLIELLAVIIILAVIALIAIPLIMNIIGEAKKGAVVNSAYGYINALENSLARAMIDDTSADYRNGEFTGANLTGNFRYTPAGSTERVLPIEISYKGDEPECVHFTITNGVVTGGNLVLNGYFLSVNSEGAVRVLEEKGDSNFNATTCQKSDSSEPEEDVWVVPVNNCTADVEMVKGAVYQNGQYTYHYLEDRQFDSNDSNDIIWGDLISFYDSDWNEIPVDGWGVSITDPSSTAQVTTNICTTINGKPIVSMRRMFENSQATVIDVSSFDTSHVLNMESMFENSNVVNLDLRHFDISNTKELNQMFSHTSNLETLNLSGWDFSSSDYNYGDYGFSDKLFGYDEFPSLTSINLSHAKLDSGNEWGTKFYFSSNMPNLEELNLDYVDTTNVSEFGVYSNSDSEAVLSVSAINLDLSHIESFYTATFNGSFVELNLPGFKSPEDTSYVFDSLEVESLNVSNWDLQELTSLSYLFSYVHAGEIIGLNTWNVSNVTSIENMFYYFSVPNLNLSGWDMSNVSNTYEMFDGATITNLNMSGVTFPGNSDGLSFYGISGLTTLNLSNVDTSNVTYMYNMFSGLSSLTTLDLSSFDTSNVVSMGNMFSGDSSLVTIYVGDNFVIDGAHYDSDYGYWTSNVDTGYMFDGCTSLVGGAGTTYNTNNNPTEYARIDTPSTPGYFTRKTN